MNISKQQLVILAVVEFVVILALLVVYMPKGNVPAYTPATSNPAASSGATATAGHIVLSAQAVADGVTLAWSLNGVSAPYGYEVVGSTTANPTYPASTSYFISEPAVRSYLWQETDGKVMNFRVCVWNKSAKAGGTCSVYSNNVTATAPQAGQSLNAGTGYLPTSTALVLTAVYTANGVNMHWTPAKASGFMAYEVLSSQDDQDPYWPKDPAIQSTTDITNVSYLDTRGLMGKTYHYRVCATQKTGLPVCGNVVTITWPTK